VSRTRPVRGRAAGRPAARAGSGGQTEEVLLELAAVGGDRALEGGGNHPVSETLGTVAALWRYPVKRCAARRSERVAIGPSGIRRPRLALRDTARRRIPLRQAGRALLAFRAVYPRAPSARR